MGLSLIYYKEKYIKKFFSYTFKSIRKKVAKDEKEQIKKFVCYGN